MQSFRPQVDDRYLPRRRLLDQLPDRPGYVVWLEAPYGYGKSVLASQWGQALEAVGWRSLWLSARDNDLRSLLANSLSLPPAAPWDAVLDALWNAKTLLVLEDLEALIVHEGLSPLLRDVRGLMLLGSRGGVNASELPRLFTQGRLVHLKADDLAFTESETEGLFTDARTARRLWARTNGWPLPLHFASLAGEMPEGAALLEGMRASLGTAEWDEALLLATLSYLPPMAAGPSTHNLAKSGFVQLGEAGYRLHALVAEALLSAHGESAVAVLRREGQRLPPLLLGEAFERCGDLASLGRLFENPRAQVYRQAPESFLRWDAMLPGPASALRRVTVGGTLKALGRFREAVGHLEAALASGDLVPDVEILALKDLCWSLAMSDAGRAADVVKRGEALVDLVDPELAGRFLSDASFVDMMAERFDEADLKLERALDYLPHDNQYRTGARINLALNRWDRHGDLDGRLAAQTDTLDAVWRVYPSDAPGQCRDLAMMHWWTGDLDGARQYLERAREGARSNPIVDLEAAAALAALDGEYEALPRLLERATVLGDQYTLDAIAMYAIDTLPAGSPIALARSYLAAVSRPALSASSYALFLAANGDPRAALEVLDDVSADYAQRPYQLYLRAARYRITRASDDLDAYLALTTAGARVLPGLIPLAELPRDRPELSLPYPLEVVLESGWDGAVKLRLADVPELELRLLGRFELRRFGRVLDLTDRQKQLVALFALGKSREEAAECIWPETDVAKQRNNMGVQFSHLRKVLEPWNVATFVFEDGLRRLRSDHGELLAALAAGDAARVYDSYSEPFAPGLGLAALDDHRQWLREEVVACLSDAAEVAAPTAALGYLNRVIELDPMNEEAVRSLIKRLMQSGRSADAQRRYRSFAERLQNEMGLEPLAETQAALAST